MNNICITLEKKSQQRAVEELVREPFGTCTGPAVWNTMSSTPCGSIRILCQIWTSSWKKTACSSGKPSL